MPSAGCGRRSAKRAKILAVFERSGVSGAEFAALDTCDLRKSFDGLHALVTERLKESPQTGALFVFTNRRRNRLKRYANSQP